jgi:hypothetical protein
MTDPDPVRTTEGESDEAVWQERASRRAAKLREREEARQRCEADQRRRREARWLCNRAAYGTEDKPIGVELSHITIDNEPWAEWIVEFTRPWNEGPGLAALDARPLPDRGDGIEAGERIFRVACESQSVQLVARQLERERQLLGKYSGDRWFPLEPANDSELGIWAFFRQIARYYDGHTWAPPVIRRPAAKGTAPNAGSATPRATAKAPRPPEAEAEEPGDHLPAPSLDGIEAALMALDALDPKEQLSVDEVRSLYRLTAVSRSKFTHSTRYVQGTQERRSPWQLPRVAGRSRSVRDPATGRFTGSRWWSVEEVRRALGGWRDRLGSKSAN